LPILIHTRFAIVDARYSSTLVSCVHTAELGLL
jgi:hypothetical protein